MILDLFEFARQSKVASGTLSAVELTRLDLADREGGIRWEAQGGRDRRGEDMLEVGITGQVSLICQRCLEPMPHDIEIHACYRVMRSEEEADAAPLDDDEFDPIVGAKEFDLAVMIEDEVLLSLPVVPRHERCPQVSASAALGMDVTEGHEKPSPFAVLSGLGSGGEKH